ncbi:MAG TPA: hypothetical protein DHV08_07460, partial [Rhodocyclaceae bacterium]|nr:hypothetical protein [Rhodocyclaceae bacterium]
MENGRIAAMQAPALRRREPLVERPSDAAALADELRRRHAKRITGELLLPAQPARHAPFPPVLDARLKSVL